MTETTSPKPTPSTTTTETPTPPPEPAAEPAAEPTKEPTPIAADEKPTREPWVEVAQDKDGWHWILWAGNGQPLCRSARVYATKKHAAQAVGVMQKNWACVRLVAVVT